MSLLVCVVVPFACRETRFSPATWLSFKKIRIKIYLCCFFLNSIQIKSNQEIRYLTFVFNDFFWTGFKRITCCTEFHYEFVVVVTAAAIGPLKSNLWAEEFNWNLFCDRFKKQDCCFLFDPPTVFGLTTGLKWPQKLITSTRIFFFIIIHPVYVKRSPSLLAFDPQRVVRLRKDDDRPFLFFSFSFSLSFFCLRSIKIYRDGHAPE